MKDNSPAIFIREDKAQEIAAKINASGPHIVAYVSTAWERHEIKGYNIRIRGARLTNDEVEPYV